ncbi:hypothetical protein [Parvibaculum sp.]|uniref:hypothetical protein n=1 Tax=Parvibaculum sp. TaxID=2024848 RepID=UPI003210376E
MSEGRSKRNYGPRFPATVGGGEWRIPMRNPALEEIARKFDLAYERLPTIDQYERADLLVQYRMLEGSRITGTCCPPYKRGEPMPPGAEMDGTFWWQESQRVHQIEDFVDAMIRKHRGERDV